jgi:hypothetical protein
MAAFPDPRPQAHIRTVYGPNTPAPVETYTNTDITFRNVTNPAPLVIPPTPGARMHDTTRHFYAADGQYEVNTVPPAANASVQPLAHTGNKWPIVIDSMNIPRGKDVYRNNGMPGQSFFNHVNHQ